MSQEKTTTQLRCVARKKNEVWSWVKDVNKIDLELQSLQGHVDVFVLNQETKSE